MNRCGFGPYRGKIQYFLYITHVFLQYGFTQKKEKYSVKNSWIAPNLKDKKNFIEKQKILTNKVFKM